MSLLSFYQQKTTKKLSKPHSKGFERSLHWNEYKTKSGMKNTANEYRSLDIFSNQTLL